MKKALLAIALALSAAPASADTALTLYSSTTNYFQLKPSAGMTQVYKLVLPLAPGTTNQILSIQSVANNVLQATWTTGVAGTASWGTITGTLSNQTDLQTVLTALGVSTNTLSISTTSLAASVTSLSISTTSLQVQLNGLATTYLTLSSAATTYLQVSSAAATYLTQSSASLTYLQISSAAATYLQKNGVTATQPILYNAATGNFSATLISATTGMMGTLQAAQEPAHTGDVTNTAGSLALTLAPIQANMRTIISSLTVVGSGGLGVTYGVVAGSMTDQNVTSALVATDANGVLVSTTINLAASNVGGNLPTARLNSGTSASGSTFWRGDGTWATPVSGGGASTLAVTTGTTAGFNTVISSPTAVIVVNGARFSVGLQGSATAYIDLLSTQTFSSVTITSNTVLAGTTFYQNGQAVINGVNSATWLTGNQSITVSGDSSGSGTTAIALTANPVQANAKTFTSSITVTTQLLVKSTTTITTDAAALYSLFIATSPAGVNVTPQLSVSTLGVVSISSNTVLPGTTFYANGQVTISTLTANLPVQTNATSSLVAKAIDAGSAQLAGTLASARMPALTGDVTTVAGNVATTAAAIQSNIKTIQSSITINGQTLFNGVVTATGTVQMTTNTLMGLTTVYADGRMVGVALGVAAHNSGTGATSSTFLRGDNTWATPAGGGGASTLAVTTGTVAGFSSVASSPTAVINFDNTHFSASLQGSATGYVNLLSTQTFSTIQITSNAILGPTTFYQDGTIGMGGSGNTTITEPNGVSGQVVLSTAPGGITNGHLAIWSSTMTLIDGGVIPAGGGGGASTLAVTTGSATGFSSVASSPTAVINFSSNNFTTQLAGSATAYVALTTTQTFTAVTITSNTIIDNTTFYQNGMTVASASGLTLTGDKGITVTYGVTTATFTANAFNSTTSSASAQGSGGLAVTYNVTAGTLTLSSIATPAAANGGTVWNDSNYNAFVSSTAMSPGYIARYVWVATSTVTNQNLTAGTTVTTNAGAGSNSNFGNPFISPNYMKVGKTFVFSADGYYGTNSTGVKLQWQVKLGTFTVCETGAAPNNSTGLNITSSAPVHMNGQITVRSTGITGSVFGQCSVLVTSGTVSNTNNIQVMPANNAATTVDTTLGNMINIVTTWNAASARNLVAITNAWIREQD